MERKILNKMQRFINEQISSSQLVSSRESTASDDLEHRINRTCEAIYARSSGSPKSNHNEVRINGISRM
jgi:ribosomal protein S3AE